MIIKFKMLFAILFISLFNIIFILFFPNVYSEVEFNNNEISDVPEIYRLDI